MRVAWLSAAAAVVGLALPAPAGAVFSKNRQPVSESDPTVGIQGGPTVGVDGAGRSLVAWTVNNAAGRGVAKVRRVEPDGSMGSVLEVSDGTMQAGPPLISFTAAGRAFLAWAERASSSDRGNVRARWLETNDQLGPQFTVEAGDATANSDPAEHAATTTSTGGAMVAWHNFDGSPGPFRHVQGRFIGADSSVGPYLFPDSVTSTMVRTEPNTTGGVLLAWRETAIRALSFDSNGGAGVLKTAAPLANANAALSTDGSDHFHLVFREQTTAGQPPTYSIDYRPLAADGEPGTEQNLDPPGTILPRFYDVATNPANRSLAAWTRSDGTRDVVKARFISNGVPEAETFSAPDATLNQDVAGVAIGGSGGGAVVYHLIETTRRTAWGRIVPPTGPAPDPIMLSSATGDVARLAVDIAPNDLGLTAWNELDPGGNRQVFIRRIGPNPDPPEQVGAGADQAVAAGLVTGGGAGGNVVDRIAPTVRRFSISSQVVMLSRVFASARRRQRKTTFRLGYSEPATARISVERRRRCPRRRSRRRRCRPYRRVGTLRAGRFATTATASFRARIGRHRLRRGRYRATAVAVDRAGNRSRPKRLRFRVVRR